MFRVGRRREKVVAVVPEGEGYLYIDKRGRVRRGAVRMRIIGNLLIMAGLLLLLGIGGWYGYTQWENDRFKEELIEQYGLEAVEPPVASVLEATPSPTVNAPLPMLTGTGTSSILSRLPKEQDSSPPVKLTIPSVEIDSPVVPVTWQMIPSKNGELKSEWQVADYAVGHHAGSVNPGQIGNVVLSGHVDYKGQVFKELHNVKRGDEVIMHTEKGQYLYVVSDIVLVLEEGASEEQKRRNAAYMNQTPDPILTMITCWPYGIDTHRLIVIARPYQSVLSSQSEFIIR
jgi:sortase A